MTAARVEEPAKVGGWRVWLAAVTAVVCAVVVVLVTGLLDRKTVDDKADQQSLDFGLPFAWIHQDQRALDPPYPAHATAVGPWDYPTSVSGLAFAGDVLVLLALLGVAVLVVRRLARPRA